jgi:hypothetical protein
VPAAQSFQGLPAGEVVSCHAFATVLVLSYALLCCVFVFAGMHVLSCLYCHASTGTVFVHLPTQCPAHLSPQFVMFGG